MFNRSSDMVVLNEDGSEWVASEVLEPITEACESAQKNEINLKEKLMKLGLNSEDAVSIEKECRAHEQEKIDRIQKKVELLMCMLTDVFEGGLISADNLKMVLDEKQVKILEMNGIKL